MAPGQRTVENNRVDSTRQAGRTASSQQAHVGVGGGGGGGQRRGSNSGGGGGGRRGSGGVAPPSASRAVNATQRPGGRRPSLREAAQAPWRSSLDLVWSYSRSQAFYGDNFASSPSFVDRHWAGPSGSGGGAGIDSSVEETSEDEEELGSDTEDVSNEDEDEDEDENEAACGVRRIGHEDAAYYAQSPAGPMEWADEQLSSHAAAAAAAAQPTLAQQRSMLGRREMRNTGERSPGRRGDGTSRYVDRTIRRIADDDAVDEDERSRSRSRSPKRTGLSRLTSTLRSSTEAQRQQDVDAATNADNPAIRSLHSHLTNSTGAKRMLYGENSLGDAEEEAPRGRKLPPAIVSKGDAAGQITERTPLLSPDDILETGSYTPQRPALRTPSWFRDSHMSVSSSKYRMQGYGTSTFWQSWFNTVNALVGVGILALPLAISYAGLVPGVILFMLCGLTTNYTGKVLAHIMAAEPTLRTYADIGNLAFGTRGRALVAMLFCLELWAVSTALLILFGDSVHALVISLSRANEHSAVLHSLATWSPAAFKAFGTLLVLPTMFLSLRLLSPISVIGIVSVVTLFVVVVADGTIKREAPGSLHQIVQPALGPQWVKLPLSFGLIMSGFSSHPIIPSLFKDMRDPKRFCHMLDWAYVAATIIYLAMGLVGYLMFGNLVSDEITRDISRSPGYPRWLNVLAICLIIVNPLSKFALAARPIVTTIEVLLGVEQSQQQRAPSVVATKDSRRRKSYNSIGEAARTASQSVSRERQENGGEAFDDIRVRRTPSKVTISEPPRSSDDEEDEETHSNGSATPRATAGNAADGTSPLVGSMISVRAAQRTAQWPSSRKRALRIAVQVIVATLIGITAVVLPGFEKVMSFLGAFLACATCVFGPLLAKLILFRNELSRRQIVLDVMLLFLFCIIAVMGTVWSFLPFKDPSIL